MTQAEIDRSEADLGLVDPACDPTAATCTLLP
jgi:hypothetical protein